MPDTHADQVFVRHKLTVHDYYRMGETGVLRPDDRVELIDGEVIDMAPIGAAHSGTVTRLNRALVMAFGDRAMVGVQNPVRLDEYNEPQPNFSVMQPRADFYTSSHPTPADLFLVIEVAETSLRYDRSIKAPLYARFGIPEYWVIVLAERVVEVYRGPGPGRYRRIRRRSGDDIIRPTAVPDVKISVRQITG